ncbi:MAG TPA: hypothetical protein VGZ28_07230 [Terriglobales bacterium]|jgi:hypothetical protein|nr:hypothetical protein [Terriglobales bacterium]
MEGKGDLIAVGRKSRRILKTRQADQGHDLNWGQRRFYTVSRKPPDSNPGEQG